MSVAPDQTALLRRAIDLSYDSLAPDEQALLRRLGVFVGGWTPPVATVVATAAAPLVLEVAPALDALVRKRLLVDATDGDTRRFDMLTTIRDYALSRLQERGERDATELAHARLFLALAERIEPELTGAEQAEWLDQIERDLGNFRAALTSLTKAGTAELALRLGSALALYWLIRGRALEGLAWLEQGIALHRAGDAVSTRVEAKARYALGWLADGQDDWERAARELLAARALFHDSGEWQSEGWALHLLGNVALVSGRIDDAEQFQGESLALFTALRDTRGQAWSLNNRGLVRQKRYDLDQAETLHAEALTLFERAGDQRGMAWGQHERGNLRYRRGAFDEAETFLHRALDAFLDLDDRLGVAWSRHNLGLIARDRRLFDLAEIDLAAALAVFQGLRIMRGEAWTCHNLGTVAYQAGNREQARDWHGRALALFEQIGDERGMAWAEHGLSLAEEQPRERKIARLRQDLERFTRVGDIRGRAWANHELATRLRRQRKLPAAAAHHQEALELFRAIGDRVGEAWSLRNLGVVMRLQGELDEAALLLSQAAELFPLVGDQSGAAWTRQQWAIAERQRGNPDEAAGLATEALRSFADDGDTQGQGSTLRVLAGVATDQHRLSEAVRLFAAADALSPSPPAAEDEHFATDVAAVRAAVSDAEFQALWTEGQATPVDLSTRQVS
jgi:tetratricopeptide (TPR) repeat protein